jgi:hypothetical protein
MALGLVRQSHLEVHALKDLLVSSDRTHPKLPKVLDVSIFLAHAEVALEDLEEQNAC